MLLAPMGMVKCVEYFRDGLRAGWRGKSGSGGRVPGVSIR